MTASTESILDEPQPKTQTPLVRELGETVVFVLVLVLLLRLFGAEAFVIPTGSMAVTLLGANKELRCPSCGWTTQFNAYDEVEGGRRVVRGLCQNCRLPLDLSKTPPGVGANA
ncbi:MAG: hypothetical protein ACRDD1_22200, partial [Planctomycetia bacterium]